MILASHPTPTRIPEEVDRGTGNREHIERGEREGRAKPHKPEQCLACTPQACTKPCWFIHPVRCAARVMPTNLNQCPWQTRKGLFFLSVNHMPAYVQNTLFQVWYSVKSSRTTQPLTTNISKRLHQVANSNDVDYHFLWKSTPNTHLQHSTRLKENYHSSRPQQRRNLSAKTKSKTAC